MKQKGVQPRTVSAPDNCAALRCERHAALGPSGPWPRAAVLCRSAAQPSSTARCWLTASVLVLGECVRAAQGTAGQLLGPADQRAGNYQKAVVGPVPCLRISSDWFLNSRICPCLLLSAIFMAPCASLCAYRRIHPVACLARAQPAPAMRCYATVFVCVVRHI